MKRIFSVLCLLLVLCSCASAKEVKPQLGGISFSAEVTYYNENYAFDGHLEKNGTLKAEITSPKELEGLNFTLNGDSVTVEYKGLSYTPVEGSMPFSRVMEEIYLPLRELALSDKVTSDKEGRVEEKGRYALTLSPTGLPQKLLIPDNRFEVRFYNISVKEDSND